MNTPYWVGEFFKVLLGYLLVGFAWPSFVFAKRLRAKTPIYKFAFCVVVQEVLVNTVVLGLGLLHILNDWTVRIFFYGVPLFVLIRRLNLTEDRAQQLMQAFPVARGKQVLVRLRRRAASWVYRVRRAARGHWLEYLLLAAAAGYALIYFSYGALQLHSYGFSDQYVHHSWIYGLKQGEIFLDGIYPESMHCMIYAVNALFGVRLYSIVLFFGGIQSVVFILAIYCLCRELFTSRYTPFFVLAPYLLLRTGSGSTEFGLTRLQCALPMEFGLAPGLFCVLFLLRYLRSAPKPHGKGRFAHCFFGTDLFLFAMALAAATAAHFYAVIIAFFLCAAVALFHLRKIFSRERFVPLVAAVLCAVLLAAAPMLGALAQGKRFQASMGWALSVMEGTAGESRYKEESVVEPMPRLEGRSFAEQIRLSAKWVGSTFYYICSRLIGENIGHFLLILIPILLACFLFFGLLLRRRQCTLNMWLRQRGAGEHGRANYGILLLMGLLLYAVYAAPYFNLPEIVSGARLGNTIWAVAFMITAIPIDAALLLLGGWVKAAGLRAVAAAALGALCAFCCSEEHYHGYPSYELSRYPADVALINQIMETYEPDTYTVVSPTDGLYQIIEHGRHEEAVDFVQGIEEGRYFLPTEYVFLFVEKVTFHYGDRYYFTGPRWLAMERAQPEEDITFSELSWEAAARELPHQNNPFDYYRNLECRTTIESRLYYWCQSFQKLYPNEMHVYYEDDRFVCYAFRQEPESPFDLAIAYGES